MTTPFFERLNAYFSNIANGMASKASAASIFPNASDVGQTRELLYGRFLEAHVPSMCDVVYGGFLFSLDGQESKQIDILVTFSASPQFRMLESSHGGKAFACVDGTMAVVSAKSFLNKETLEDSLSNFAAIPMQQPLAKHKPLPQVNLPGYIYWPYKIIYACDGISEVTLLHHLIDFYKANPSIPVTRRVDFIHVLGKYHIVRTGEKGRREMDGSFVGPNLFALGPVGDDAWPLASVICTITTYAAGARFMLFDFDDLVDGMAADSIRREGYRRGNEKSS